MGDWQQVGENLVRHKGGTIYLRAKVAGKIKRVSLGTKDLRIAKIKRDDTLETLRKAAEQASGPTIRTLGDAVDALSERVLHDPSIEATTVIYYREIFTKLRNTLALSTLARSWTADEAAAWWKSIAAASSPQRANNALGMLRRVAKLMIERGIRLDDPTEGLRRRKIDSRPKSIPDRDTIERVVNDIAGQRKAHSKQAANYVGFLAYAGCRIGQARALRWEDIEGDWITFRSGVSGTKGAQTRCLPISSPLRAVIDDIGPKKEGPVFTMKDPDESLKNACRRLKVPHIRLHDLRHFFASYSLKSGVDVPTVSRWLGHKDGGVLVLRTYGHLWDSHSLASASKL